MKKIVIIPARYQSTRFPGKPLVPLLGKPMILHVAEIAEKALTKENVFIATDDLKIAKTVDKAGFQVLMTTSDALTGTDRLWEAAQQVKADIYLNVQGDEPLIDPNDIIRVAKEKCNNYDSVINCKCKLSPSEDPHNNNIPKVVTAFGNKLTYMSRLPIPGYKANSKSPQTYWKQVCIYAFNYKELEAFGTYGKKGAFEKYEDIEILRFFDLNIPIKMVETKFASLAVDIPEDVPMVEAALKTKTQ